MKQLRIVMVGDVDAGKSTILGRLLVDIGQVTPEKLAELESSSAKRGVPIEYSFLLGSASWIIRSPGTLHHDL